MKILSILLLFFAVASGQMETPSKSMSAADEFTDIDEKGRIGAKKDKKIFANMLFVYGQVRQTAEGALEMLKDVSNLALKSFHVLVRVETYVKTSQEMKENFKKYKEVFSGNKNIFQAFDKFVTHTYENIIVKGTDAMWMNTAGLLGDVKEMNDARQNIAVSAINIGNAWNFERDTVWKVDTATGDSSYSVFIQQENDKINLKKYRAQKMGDYQERLKEDSTAKAKMSEKMTMLSDNLAYQSKMAAQAVNMTDTRLIKKYEFNPNAKLQGARAEVTSSAIANVSSRREQHENNYQELLYAISMTNNTVENGEGSLTAAVKAEVLGAENTLYSTYIEHETLNDFIKVMGALTISKMESLSNAVHHKALLTVSADNLVIVSRAAKEEHLLKKAGK